jgi:hypothetical protein
VITLEELSPEETIVVVRTSLCSDTGNPVSSTRPGHASGSVMGDVGHSTARDAGAREVVCPANNVQQ